MRFFKVMNYLMKKHIPLVILSLFMGTFTVLSSIGMFSTSSVLISKAALHPDVLDLMILIVGVRFFGISRGTFRYLERIFSHDTTFRVLSSVRKWFYKNFEDTYSENNKAYRKGDIYSKIASDVDSLKEYYLRGVYPLIIAILTGIITAVFLSYFNKIISYYYILIYFFCGIILPLVLFIFNTKLIEKESEIKKELNLILLDVLKGILEVTIYSMKEEFNYKFNLLNNKLSKIQKKKNLIATAEDNIHALFVSLGMVMSLLVAAPLVVENKLSGIYYAMLPLAIMASFEALLQIPSILYKLQIAHNAGNNILSIIENSEIDRFNSFKTHTPQKSNTTFNNNFTAILSKNNSNNNERDSFLSYTSSSGHIFIKKELDNYNLSVENLSVYNKNSGNFIIKELFFNLPYGKKIGIVGLSGSGKSSILKTLMGFMKFQKGDIKLGDISYDKLALDEIRKVYTYVEQNPYIFNTTIKENLLIANTEVDEYSIIDALKKVQILNLIKELPEGLDTLLGEYGSKVSGGEKQRLAIARALLKDSKIVLLDEPTASLDVGLEKKVIDSIHDAIKDKSCIWVTHRLVSMDRMDEILVIHKGEVVERGTHSVLLNNKGQYYKLWSAQHQYLF